MAAMSTMKHQAANERDLYVAKMRELENNTQSLHGENARLRQQLANAQEIITTSAVSAANAAEDARQNAASQIEELVRRKQLLESELHASASTPKVVDATVRTPIEPVPFIGPSAGGVASSPVGHAAAPRAQPSAPLAGSSASKRPPRTGGQPKGLQRVAQRPSSL